MESNTPSFDCIRHDKEGQTVYYSLENEDFISLIVRQLEGGAA